ncbi:MAG: hypothetical protein AB7N71_12540 [Phycisphaerae bacterium]
MRRYALLFSITAGMFLSMGCATVVRTSEENQARYGRQLDLMMRQLGDDVDLLLLAERQSRLSQYHTR